MIFDVTDMDVKIIRSLIQSGELRELYHTYHHPLSNYIENFAFTVADTAVAGFSSLFLYKF